MKNKFTLILLLIMILGVSPAFAADATVENLDILEYQIFSEGCVGCGDKLVLTDLNEQYIKNASLKGKSQYECDELADHKEVSDSEKTCDFAFNISYNISDGKGLKFVYAEKEFQDMYGDDDIVKVNTANYSNKDPKKVKNDHDDVIDRYKKEYIDAIKDLYKSVNIHGTNYYIYAGLLENNSFDRNLYIEKGGIVSLLSFNKDEIDLYYSRNDAERSIERVDDTYQITNYYNDGTSNAVGKNDPNKHQYILANEKAIYFVCNKCRTCKDCAKNVAVSGASIDDNIVLSKYCAVHTCAFIWDVTVVSGLLEKGVIAEEGLICKEKKGTTDYCDAHKCSCGEPIVGVNTNLILKVEDKVNHFTGNNEFSYSNYCETHFCRETGCRNIRSNNAADKGYCSKHADVCSYPKCVNKITKKESGIRLCDTCKKIELKTTLCTGCGQNYYGDECLNCKFGSGIYDISAILQKEGIEVEGRKVPAEYIAWYSDNTTFDEDVTVVDADALSKCTHGESERYIAIHDPGSTWYHLEYTICRICGPLKREEVKHTYSNGECKCGALEKDKVNEIPVCEGEHVWVTVYGKMPNFQDEALFARENHCVYKKCSVCLITDGTVAYAKHGNWKTSEDGTRNVCGICGYSLFNDYSKDGMCIKCGKAPATIDSRFCSQECKSDSDLSMLGLCKSCGQYRILRGKDEGLCYACAKKEAPEVDATAEITIHQTVAITINPVMSYNTCKHNHPILGSVKFIRKSNLVHTQEWLCAGCNKELSQDFNHTPLRNGKCICEI